MITEHLLRKAVTLFIDGLTPNKGMDIDKIQKFLSQATEHLKQCDALQEAVDIGQDIADVSPAARRSKTNSAWRPNE
jgi:hypothetical protein